MNNKEKEDFINTIERIIKRLRVVGVPYEAAVNIVCELNNPEVLEPGGMEQMLKEHLTAKQFLMLNINLN